MAISASLIKQLRERTGAGMLDCKQALADSGGELEAAVEALRKKGIAAAERKAGRIAAEGVIAAAGDARAGVLVEVNCETDFVAKDASFAAFASQVAEAVLAAEPADSADPAVVAALTLASGDTVESARQALIAKIGENISVRRFAFVKAEGDERISAYLHGARIGVLVRLGGGDDSLGRDLAMHIAASAPLCIDENDLPAETLAREKAIYTAQAEDSGKPAQIIEKMVAGRAAKYLKENTLLGQPFVKDPERSVGKLVAAAGARVAQFARLEVGEGLEKREEDFVAEVMAQAGRTD